MQSDIERVSKYIKIIFGISITFSVFYIFLSIYFTFLNLLIVALVVFIVGSTFTGLSIGIMKKSKVCAIIALVLVSLSCLSNLLARNAFTFAIELLLVFLYIMAVKQINAYHKLVDADAEEQNEQA